MMLDNTATFTATTMSTKGKTYHLKETVFYVMEQKDLEYLADHLFGKAYEKLEKTLFFATGFGVVLGMIIMAIVK